GSYYLKQWGHMAKNEWVYDKNAKNWFFINADGTYAHDTWKGSYYLKQWGHMAKNEWVYDKNAKNWFFINADGTYAHDTWKGSYYLKQWGHMAKQEWIKDKGNWYYIKVDGTYARNQWQAGYYLGNYGQMLTNTTTPDGYQVDGDGKWINKNHYGDNYDKSLFGWNLTSDQVAYTDAEARRISNKIITSEMSDREKCKVITAWIFGNTYKDDNQGTEIYKKTHADTSWAVFKNHKAACSGYVRAFKLLGKYAGLKVEIVNEDQWAHQWNRVYLADEGKWIACDSQIRMVDRESLTPKYFGFYLKEVAMNEEGRLQLIDADREFLYIEHKKEDMIKCWDNREKDADGYWTDGFTTWEFTLEEYMKALDTYKEWRKFESEHMGIAFL
ncbi:transglutaminase domain-containing protein, partial [Granulicatella balaenopterae]